MDTLIAPAPAGATAAPTRNYDPTTLCLIDMLQSHLGSVVAFDDLVLNLPRDGKIDDLLASIVSSHLRGVKAFAERYGRWSDTDSEDWAAYMRLLRKIRPNLP